MHIPIFGGLVVILLLEAGKLKNSTSLGLSQIISVPTNFEPNRNLSCIDIVVILPNLILDGGTRAPLDSYCHYQIIQCKVNFGIPPPPFERKINIEQIQLPLEDASPAFPGFNTLILIRTLTGKHFY